MRWAPELLIIIQLYYPWKKWNSFSHLNLPLVYWYYYTQGKIFLFCFLLNKTITLLQYNCCFCLKWLREWDSNPRPCGYGGDFEIWTQIFFTLSICSEWKICYITLNHYSRMLYRLSYLPIYTSPYLICFRFTIRK